MWSFALCLLICVPGNGQLTMMWNGTVITSDTPTLIFHDELFSGTGPITDPTGPGRLICTSQTPQTVFWAYPTANSRIMAGNTTDNFFHRREGTNPVVSRLSLNPDNPIVIPATEQRTSGLWRCNEANRPTIYVGIYARAQGLGALTSNIVTLSTPTPFQSNTFTLTGDTRGGPPTSYSWTRNGEAIAHGGPYDISMRLSTGASEADRRNPHYISSLTVTGHLPGVYEYISSNRATTNNLMASLNIQGEAPTNLMSAQTGLNTVEVSWVAPEILPGDGYRISTNSSTTVLVSASPHTLALLRGVHSILVTSLSQHLPGRTAELHGVIVKDTLAPVVNTSSLTATSVTISWTQPPLSFIPAGYTVTLSRVTGNRQTYCADVSDDRPSIETTQTSEEFSNLEEFSSYTITIDAAFSVFGFTPRIPTSLSFVTLRAAPTGTPRNIVFFTTSGSVNVSWDDIDCIDRNGVNISYKVLLQEVDGTVIVDSGVEGQTFTHRELQPFTSYTFQVAGVNEEGRGPFSDAATFLTDEDVPGVVANFAAHYELTSVVFTWDPVAPQERNGIIIAYELTYTVNGMNITVLNISDVNFTKKLDLGTNITEVSLRAYTSAGPGEAVNTSSVFIPIGPPIPIVQDVQLTQVMGSETSVLLSWEELSNDFLSHYTVYYSQVSEQGDEMFVAVPGTNNSIIITDLVPGTSYQFQITIIISFLGEVLEGERTLLNVITLKLNSAATPPSPDGCTGETVNVVISVIVTFIFTVTINNAFYCFYFARQHIISKTRVPVEKNAAYALSSRQQPQNCKCVLSDANTESDYATVR